MAVFSVVCSAVMAVNIIYHFAYYRFAEGQTLDRVPIQILGFIVLRPEPPSTNTVAVTTASPTMVESSAEAKSGGGGGVMCKGSVAIAVLDTIINHHDITPHCTPTPIPALTDSPSDTFSPSPSPIPSPMDSSPVPHTTPPPWDENNNYCVAEDDLEGYVARKNVGTTDAVDVDATEGTPIPAPIPGSTSVSMGVDTPNGTIPLPTTLPDPDSQTRS